MKLIAETAWHHEGDYEFMKNLVTKISTKTEADIVKLHITLNFDEYMHSSHDAYSLLKPWLFNRSQWNELIEIVRCNGKQIMLLLNDTEAIKFGLSFSPEYIEIHSTCLNDVFMLEELRKGLSSTTKVVLGIGGASIDEIDHAINYIKSSNMLLMFGFQNYPTVHEDVNLNKIRKIMRLFDNLEYGYADHTAWDSSHNELITLLVAANGMSYIEKHVTTHFGEKRVDWPAAISIEMFNKLSKKIKILNEVKGNGELSMNQGELNYSIYGPMKKTAILKKDTTKGDVLTLDMIRFIRTNEISDMSQVELIKSVGKKINKNLKCGTILMNKYLIDKE
ncbi:N-acetylneuraminate synthase family protein [Methylophilaceae bacterium]|jgi:N,N'-diacetyllegionaminate synthase|nr:N-acetylneuraminate synthase family protein [Methylophilaceae bacterium]